MTWFKDSSGHVLESRSIAHRLIYCPLCKKLISKADCKKLRYSNKNGILYEVKCYHRVKLSQIERTQQKEVKKRKRLVRLSYAELNKVIKHIL